MVRSASSRCSLCREETDLIGSHIIPDFMWKRVYDDGHKIIALGSKQKATRFQQGIREQMMCSDCDNGILNRHYERPSVSAWRTLAGTDLDPNIQGARLIGPTGREFLTFSGLDYRSIKLLMLSILWRAAVSTHDAFSQVNLGDDLQEELRAMILDGAPGSPDRFPFILYRLEKPFDGITMPTKEVLPSGATVITLVLTSLVASFYLPELPRPEIAEFYSVTEGGTIRLLVMPIEEFGGAKAMMDLVESSEIPERWL